VAVAVVTVELLGVLVVQEEELRLMLGLVEAVQLDKDMLVVFQTQVTLTQAAAAALAQ
jgi:hypothetical protein